jgi:urease subunit alpha
VPDGVRLGDTALQLVPEDDGVGGPDQILAGFGGTLRDGLGVRAGRGGVELAIVGGLVADPVLGVRRASLGIADGRIVAIGRAGNPDTMDGIDVVLGPATAVLDATGMIVTPGAIDPHVHWLSPQVADTALAGGITTLVIQDFGPVWNLGCNPAEGLAATWAALEAVPLNAVLLVRGSSVDPAPVEAALRARGAEDPRGRRRRRAADRDRAGPLRGPRRPAGDSHRRPQRGAERAGHARRLRRPDGARVPHRGRRGRPRTEPA